MIGWPPEGPSDQLKLADVFDVLLTLTISVTGAEGTLGTNIVDPVASSEGVD